MSSALSTAFCIRPIRIRLVMFNQKTTVESIHPHIVFRNRIYVKNQTVLQDERKEICSIFSRLNLINQTPKV